MAPTAITVARARGVGHPAQVLLAGVAGRRDDHHAACVRVADRGEDLGDLGRDHAAVELERQVDDVGAVVGGVADRLGDRQRVALAEVVEHLERHDLDPVRDPGDRQAVVGRLGDRAGHVGAVPVAVVRMAVVVDEVPGVHERGAAQVRSSPKAAVALERHAAVEHGHGRAAAARRAGGWRPATTPRACRCRSGPLKFHCLRRPGSLGMNCDGMRDVVGHRVGNVRLGLEPVGGLGHRLAALRRPTLATVPSSWPTTTSPGTYSAASAGRASTSRPSSAARRRRRRVDIGYGALAQCTNARTTPIPGSCDGLRHGLHGVHRRARGRTCGRGTRRPRVSPTGTRRGWTGSAASRWRPSKADVLDRAALRRAFRGCEIGLPCRRPGRLAAARAGLAGQRAGAADSRRGGGRRGRPAGRRDLECGRYRPGAGRPAGHRGGRLPRLGPRPDLSGCQARGRVGGAGGRRAARRRGRRGEPFVRVRRAGRPLAAGRDLHADDRQLPARAAARRGGRADQRRRRARRGQGPPAGRRARGGPASATCWAATT